MDSEAQIALFNHLTSARDFAFAYSDAVLIVQKYGDRIDEDFLGEVELEDTVVYIMEAEGEDYVGQDQEEEEAQDAETES